MIRKLALVALVATLSLSGCKKLKEFSAKKKPAATPAPVAVATPDPTPEPKPKAPAAPPKVTVDPHAEVVVLCYHRIEGKAGGSLSIEPALFEEQMKKIKDSGIPVIPMQDFLAWRRGEKNIPPKSIIITIDDGYVSGYDVGWPILKKYGFPFTMYVYLTYINTGGKAVTWAQLAEMRDAGVDIGSHTVLHSDLKVKPRRLTGAQLSLASIITPMDYDSWLKYELEHSKQVIEEKLGIKCNTIAYPYGLNNEKVREAAKAAGYEAAFTTYGARLGLTTPSMGLGRYDVTTKDARGVDSFTVGLSFKGMAAPGGEAAMAQESAVAMITEPMNGETVVDAKPTIKANLASMGALDAGTVVMRISGLGAVPAKYDEASGNISFTPPQPLKVASYRVIISAKSNGRPVETGWSFNYSPDGNPPPESLVPQIEPTAAPASKVAPVKKKK
ncbi:MAG: polysaccharide deacetylase family protein [Chthoniobacteraceae bacterium]